MVLDAQHVVELSVEDGHVGEACFGLVCEASLDELAQGNRHLRVVLVDGLHEVGFIQLIASGFLGGTSPKGP